MTSSPWLSLLQLAHSYPSPHNSQPIKIKLVDETNAELYYDKKLGLPAESFGIAFGYVCVGVFLEILSIVARNNGYILEEKIDHQEMNFSDLGLHFLGKLHLKKGKAPEKITLQDVANRQTSRLPYNNKFASDDVIDEVKREAEAYGYTFHYTTDEKLVKEIIYVNQRTLFYDLEDTSVRNEIKGYLRYSHKEAAEKKDGLSAECLIMPGQVLQFVMNHPGIWDWPVIGALLKNVYLNSMKGVPQIAWLTGKFEKNKDYLQGGKCFIRVWLLFTKHNIYLHPFGSVITNTRAHKEFCDLVGEQETNGMAWMLFRYGYSKKPPVAFKREVETMIIS